MPEVFEKIHNSTKESEQLLDILNFYRQLTPINESEGFGSFLLKRKSIGQELSDAFIKS